MQKHHMLADLFEPRSIMVIGASGNPQKVGYSLLNNLLQFGYCGRVYPVNPAGGSIKEQKVYECINDIHEDIDVALIAIPAKGIPLTLRECIRKKVKFAIVISAGFKEVGAEGTMLEEEIEGIAREGNIRILGPNCLGIMNTCFNLNATFARWMLPVGRISFFSQSGALGIAILDWAISNGIGFSKFISLGNKVDLNESDFIEFLMEDPDTDVILGYIEDVVEGERFLETARKCTSVKPIILIKSGGTQAGARAASSHTGALAGSEVAFNAAFKQTGIIRASGVRDLFEIAQIFISRKKHVGDKLLIVTNAGGPGIIAADHADMLGFQLPLFNNEVIERLRNGLPRNASLYNPVDVLGDATSERYRAVLGEVPQSNDFDSVLVIVTPQAMTDVDTIADEVIRISESTDSLIFTSFMGSESTKGVEKKLNAANIPNYPYPEVAIHSLKMLVNFSQWRNRKAGTMRTFSLDKEPVRCIIERFVKKGVYALDEEAARECLETCGFVFPKRTFVVDRESASRESMRTGFPVVMKVSSPDVLHKTDVGGVKLGIKNQREVEEAFVEITSSVKRRMPNALIRGVNIYEMITGGREVIIGITYDRTFGHMIMFGLGGIYVEVLKDVSFRVVPVTETDVREMLLETKSFRLLKGIRGEESLDINSLVDAILKLNHLILTFPEIHELDINPLVVKAKGVVALDARIIIHGG
ncbi:MAG: acetate--CoA ligase family protein [Candidatus Brocadiaceae bacterium]|nr:acetate--CoA ligase family protein [Candidatus Brocadiaceae bacterium]